MGVCLDAKSCGPLEAKALRSMDRSSPFRMAIPSTRLPDKAVCWTLARHGDRQELSSLSGIDPSF